MDQMKKKQKPIIWYLQEAHSTLKTHVVQSEGMEEDIPCTENQKIMYSHSYIRQNKI